ncbi:hypothetical protein Dda_1116 [Drechslerella dactyloides]|uniref:C2H2-type domain-containing protein n=1 Tax=Drechslerella dactyloides TaxID=74499 RepID=A0AAD6J6Q4_DREDA|nr:hypothetical protein Dda_1116 [Drechslerella dactyloides]
MSSNYYGYTYGNTAYSQSQPYSEQYSSTGGQPSTYYSNEQHSQSHQISSTTRQSPPEVRPATTQYNGLHFPAPTPARQTTAPHDINRQASATNAASRSASGRPHGSGTGSASGYGSAGLYQSSATSSSQPSRPRNDGAAGHDRAEQALSAAGWGGGSDVSSTNHSTLGVASSTDHGYPYQKSDTSSQQSYYPQRTSTTSTSQPASISTNYHHKASYDGTASQTRASSASNPRQSAQSYLQHAQSGAPNSYGRSYESAPRTDATHGTSAYQQTSEYGKTYQDDTEQSQSYLQRIYTLPQPTPMRTVESTNSYFLSNASEPSYASSSQQSKPSTNHQATYERTAKGSGRDANATSTSAHSYATTTPSHSDQQYYQNYNSGASAKSHAPKACPTTSTAPTTQPEVPVAPVSVPHPVPPAKKQRVSASQKSPTANTTKPRAPRKSKAAVAVNPTGPSDTFYSATSVPSGQAHLMHTDQSAGQPAASQASASKSGVLVQDLAIDVSSTPAPASGQPSSVPSGPVMDMAFMEQHMREMVEKMREYQAKDPTAFQQVWENVKRSGPAATGGKPAAPLPMSTSTSTPGMNSPNQGVASLAKPTRQPARQPTPAAPPSDAGRNTPIPGSAASEAQKTVWPATQKVALSKMASQFFTNYRQKCSESFIMSLLDVGPTFTELCQKLENKGYKFERNKLATELLKTSGTDNAAGGKPTKTTAAPAISAATPPAPTVLSSNSTSAFGVCPETSSASHSMENPSQFFTPQSIKSFNPRNIKDSIPSFPPMDNSRDPSQNFVAPSMIFREVYTPHFSQPESNVRSEEQNVTPAPAPLPSPAPAPIPLPMSEKKTTKKTVSYKRVSMSKRSQTPKTQTHNETHIETHHTPALVVAVPESQAPVAPQPSFPPATREEAMPDASPTVVPPPESRLENFYGPPATTTFSVPAYAEEHNSVLNRLTSKLLAQVTKFETLESSPRPAAPPAPMTLPSSRPPIPQPPPPQKVVLPKAPAFDKKYALRRNTYDPQTIVHAVLLATGRHPHYEGLNSRLAILKRLHPETFDNNTDLAQIPWDLYDPPPAPLPGEEKKSKKSDVVDEEESRGRTRDPVPFTPGTLRTEHTSVSVPAPVPSPSSDGKIRGKRGRPRGSRGTPRGGGRGGGATLAGAGAVRTHTPGTDSSTAANAHKYGTVTRVNINSLRGGSNGSGGDGGGKKRKHGDSPHSRHPGSPHESSGRTSLLPVFKCQWDKCDHELQNLDTLRRHLVGKHKSENSQGVLPCCWGDCGSLIPVVSQDPQTGKKVIESHRKRLNFGTGQAWDNHVLGEHLKLLKDRLGEGMSVKAAHSVEGRIRSMSRDRDGRSITPVITPAPFGYKFTPPPGFPSTSQFRLAHEFENGLPDEKKLLEDEQARAERIGAGMDESDIAIPPIQGSAYDDHKGHPIKSKKLTKDLSVLPAVPVAKSDKEKKKGEGKGKEKAT